MNLIEFCTYQGGTGAPSCPVLRRMAARNGVAIRTLYMIARGHKLPGARLCSRLEAYTNGTVKREDLRPDIFRAAAGACLSPAEPDVALLVSMAMRLDHGFGLATPERQESRLRDMRKLWEEVVGRGYYSPDTRERYAAMLSARPEVKP